MYLSRDPDPAWQSDLETVVPRSDRVNWLWLAWEPGIPTTPDGDVYQPVQRWEIREMVPRLEHVPDEIVDALQGPDPALSREWYTETDEDGRPIGTACHNPSPISRGQWLAYRTTGCYSLRCWIIQGSHGGHKWTFNPREASLLKSMGRPHDTPAPGDLPYAEYDRRVRDKLVVLDRLRRWESALAFDQRQYRKTDAGLYVARDRIAEAQEYNAIMLKWLDTQIEDAVANVPRWRLPQPSDGVTEWDGQFNADEDALDEHLLTETSLTTE